MSHVFPNGRYLEPNDEFEAVLVEFSSPVDQSRFWFDDGYDLANENGLSKVKRLRVLWLRAGAGGCRTCPQEHTHEKHENDREPLQEFWVHKMKTHNVGVDAAARFHSSIAGRIKLRNAPPPLASNDLFGTQRNNSIRLKEQIPIAFDVTINRERGRQPRILRPVSVEVSNDTRRRLFRKEVPLTGTAD